MGNQPKNKIRFREVQHKDVAKIDEIYQQYHSDSFGITYTSDSIHGVVVDDTDSVIGYGLIRLIPEVIMVLDLGRERKEKILALQELIRTAVFKIEQSDYSSLHAFVQDDNFSEILKKHFGFKKVIGEAIVLEVK